MEHATEEEKKNLITGILKKPRNVQSVQRRKNIQRTKVDEKMLRLIHKHNEIGHDHLRQN